MATMKTSFFLSLLKQILEGGCYRILVINFGGYNGMKLFTAKRSSKQLFVEVLIL